MSKQRKFPLVDKDRTSVYEYRKRDSVYIIIGIVLSIVAIVLGAFVWQDSYALVSGLFTSLFISCFVLYEIDSTRCGVNAIFIFTKGRNPNIEYSFVIGTALIYWAINTIALRIIGEISGFLVGWIVFEAIMCFEYEYKRETNKDYESWLFVGTMLYGICCLLGGALGSIARIIQLQ